ncbi:MAG: hypothetical protein H6815_06850 [Phycisphaeraceae bacterium]|nr:hypothetical protein [Phycisphaerales bacterium]MCB9860157.1 hypothetical protein [Phycisphaeraceae bacterium]
MSSRGELASWKKGCGAVVVVVLVAILSGGLWLNWRLGLKPKITRNFVAEINTRLEKIPESDRAWPLFVDAMILDAQLSDEERERAIRWSDLSGARPGDPAWDEAVDAFEVNRSMLELASQIAAKPVLGAMLSDQHDPRFARAIGEAAVHPNENPSLINILLPHLGTARNLSKMLAFDARAALETHDPDRFVQRMDDLCSIASMVSEDGTLISQLVGYAICGLMYSEIGLALQDYSAELAESHLDKLDSVLDRIEQNQVLSCNMSVERMFFDDMLQRTYSDDGNGNGRMTRQGVKELDELMGGFAFAADANALTALNMFGLASRKELDAFADEFYATAQTYADTPLYSNAATPEEVIEKYMPSEYEQRRYMIAHQLVPALGQAAVTRWQILTHHGAMRARVATERYLKDNGTMPQSLDVLLPDYLAELPKDLLVDAPLQWRETEYGWTLYSVGYDKNDDGGAPETDDAGLPTNGNGRQYVNPRNKQTQPCDWVIFPVFHVPVTQEGELDE